PSPAVEPAPSEPAPSEAGPASPGADGGSSEAASPRPVRQPTARPTAEPAAAPEMRAVWIHLFDDTLKSRASIDRMLDRVAAANLNTVIVEVVRRHDAYYDSSVLPRSTDPELEPGLDVLAHAIAGARERGLAVHAWIPTMPAHHHAYDDFPAPPGWLWDVRGPDAPVADRWVSRAHDGEWGDHLDPGVPAVRQHIAAIAREIASRYDVDGIHLDYTRYAGEEWGYHPLALERFRAETGRKGTPAPEDATWSDWRRAQSRALVTETVAAVREVAPGAAVTSAVIAQGQGPSSAFPFSRTKAYADYFQDWPEWARSGLLDAVLPMNYFDARRYSGWFSEWVAFERTVAAEAPTAVVGGFAGYLNRPAESVVQLGRLLAATDGVSLYSYQGTAEEPDADALLAVLLRQVWPQPAPPLDLTVRSEGS
ncbi:MAG: family 10 glycosylhydrolase, partial [Nitriliruptorales bacterium]